MLKTISLSMNEQLSITEMVQTKKVVYFKSLLTTSINKNGIIKKMVKPPMNWNSITRDTMDNHINSQTHNAFCLITGKLNNISVIDIDDMNIYNNFIKYNPHLSRCKKVKTNKGYHLYFRYSDKLQTTTDNKLKIDVRNDGAFVFIPPTKYNLPDNQVIEYIEEDGDFMEYNNELESYKDSLKPVKKVIEMPESNEPNINKYLDLIDIEYWDNYKSWCSIVFACKNEGLFINVIKEYSKKSIKYTEQGFYQVYNSYKNDRLKHTIGTIKFYAKKSSPTEYSKIYYPNKFLNGTDKILLETFLEQIKGEFIYCKGHIYIWFNNRWIIDKNNQIITCKYMDIMNDYLYDYINANKPVKQDDKTEADYQKVLDEFYKKINKVRDSISNQRPITNVLSLFNKIIIRYDSEDVFDKQPNIFCFTNTAFDLETKQQIDITKEMYITQNTGYEYISSTPEQFKYLSEVLKKIFPNEEVRQCAIDILYSGMKGVSPEKFFIFNGNGRNGKGVLNTLYSSLLGDDYSYKINSSILVKEPDNGETANPALVQMNKKRYIFCEEFDENDKINMKIIKSLTGGGVLKARDLHKTIETINNYSTLVLECNIRPEINGEIQQAIVDRIIDIEFESTFTSNKDQLNQENHYELDSNLKTGNFIQTYKNVLFDFLLKYGSNNIGIPSCVKERSMNYLGESCEIMNWFKEHHVLTKSDTDYIRIKDIYKAFQQSEIYKQNMKESKIKSKLSANILTKDYFYERKKIGSVNYASGLWKWKLKTI